MDDLNKGEVEYLREQNDSLKMDAARIDFMESCERDFFMCAPNTHGGPADTWLVLSNGRKVVRDKDTGERIPPPEYFGRTLRDAIDAAMKKK